MDVKTTLKTMVEVGERPGPIAACSACQKSFELEVLTNLFLVEESRSTIRYHLSRQDGHVILFHVTF